MNRCGTVRVPSAKSGRGPDLTVISRTFGVFLNPRTAAIRVRSRENSQLSWHFWEPRPLFVLRQVHTGPKIGVGDMSLFGVVVQIGHVVFISADSTCAIGHPLTILIGGGLAA